MRLNALFCLSAASIFAHASHVPAATPSTPSIDTPPQATPAPELVEGHPNLELRQAPGGGVATDATLANGQVPAITTYGIAVPVGTTDVYTSIVFTQLFTSPLVQWPQPTPGTIGYGTLQQKKQKRAVDTGYVAQPIVLAMETVIVTQPLRKVTQVLVIDTVVLNNSTAVNGTSQAGSNGTANATGNVSGRPTGYSSPATLRTAASRALITASA